LRGIDAMNMQVSSNEIANIQRHEGTELNPYWDLQGYSIGTGHFGGSCQQGDFSVLINNLAQYGITPDTTSGGNWITLQDAAILLYSDLQNAVSAVNNGLTRAVSQNAFDALVDFAYGAGVGAVKHPIADINLGDYQSAANYIASWVHDSQGNVIPDLQTLRNQTAAIILADANYKPNEAGFGWIAGGILLFLAAPKIIDYVKKKKYVRQIGRTRRRV